jgi:hypothetical protein
MPAGAASRSMRKRTLAVALLAGLLAALPALRAQADPSAKPSAAEAPFVNKATADLEARYPTAADAEKAGYFRYTDEDGTGSISYTNLKWTSADADHPSQLWYDAKGRLLGADYSVPYTPEPPKLFGMDPSRWQKFGAHVHYGLAGSGDTVVYGAAGAKTMAKGGGTVDHPTAAALVAAGIAKKPEDVKFVFEFPAIWDLEFWVLPNPAGAFAEKNPNVKPVNPKPMDM